MRFLQQVTGEAPASILVKIYLQAELNQGQPALVPRASVLGPVLARWPFSTGDSHHCHFLRLQSFCHFLLCQKGAGVLAQNKTWVFSPAPAPWEMEGKMRQEPQSWCLHSLISVLTPWCMWYQDMDILSPSLSFGGAALLNTSLQNKLFHTALPSKANTILELE